MRRHPHPLLAIAAGFCLTLFAFTPDPAAARPLAAAETAAA